jgi:predicted dehydrogenase
MLENLDRRTFLTASTIGGATLVLPDAASAAAVQGANNRIVVGVMGTGGRGTALARGFQQQPNVEVAYTCDADMGRAEAAAQAVAKVSGRAAPRAVQNYQRILDDKTVDLLIVATCNHWHAPATILACSAGKHVYVEKPCSHTPREGELMVQAARKHQRKVQMGNQRRSYTAVAAAMEELRKGAIGRVYLAESWYQNTRPSIQRGNPVDPPKSLDYELWQGPAPRRPYRSNYHPYNWHWFWHYGNGELGNNGVHIIDLCRWGLGVDYPVRVTSTGGRYRWEDDQETPDTNIVCYEFEGRKMITWEGLSCSTQPNRPYHALFHGENGTLALSDSSYVVTTGRGKEARTRTEKVQAGDAPHFINLLNAIRNNERLNSEIEEGHKTTLLCHLGNIAYRLGRVIRTSPRDGTILEDKNAQAMWTREYHKGMEPRV